jgi:hypothetical protein
MSDPQQSMNALAGQVLTPTDHVVIGAQLGQAGLNNSEVSNLIGLIERTAQEMALKAARDTALSIVPVITKLIADTHQQAALEIYRRITNQTGGFGGVTVHRKCAQIAWDVSQSVPRHVAVSATPILGSVR